MVRKVRRRKGARKHVPGWGGIAGRVAGMGMKYVSKGGMAYKALKLARKVANAVNIEYKIFDTQSSTTPDYTGTVVTLNTPSQGTTDIQRIGDSIKCQNLVLRGYAIRQGADVMARVMVLWDPQNKITASSDILETVGSSYSVFSPKHYDKRFQSRVLFDKTIKCFSSSLGQDFDVTIPIDQHTQFSAGTTTINTGALKVLVISNTLANQPSIILYSRLSFTDD